ncbi:MAG: hypothetical protein MUF00_01120 [Gemmatimonadaceae bacterium]|jgi:hypothetical protein|nr:hypothetical protein [Gemmatimonadaceae bacterium]
MPDRAEYVLEVQAALVELDRLASALATPHVPDGARLLTLVDDRQQVLDRVAGVLARVDVDRLELPLRKQLHRALERSAQLGELARRAVEQHAQVVTRELTALDAVAEAPEMSAAGGRLDAHG